MNGCASLVLPSATGIVAELLYPEAFAFGHESSDCRNLKTVPARRATG